MLKLTYACRPAGAPDSYGEIADPLRGPDGAVLQEFRKASPGKAEPERKLRDCLRDWVEARPTQTHPITVMVHGYLYDPRRDPGHGDSPLHTVFAQPNQMAHPALSWLPLVGEWDDDAQACRDNGIAFCYTSLSSFGEAAEAGWENRYQYAVFDQSPLAARALAAILACLGGSGRTLRILAHSLGTRTASQAIGVLGRDTPAKLDRIVLLDGAEFSAEANRTLVPRGIDVVNICSRVDNVLHLGGDSLLHPFLENNSTPACVIGRNGVGNAAHWLDLQLDRRAEGGRPAVADWLAAGHAPTGKPYRVSAYAMRGDPHPFAELAHWCCYTGDGNRAFVRDLVLHDAMTVQALRSAGAPEGSDGPSWNRFDGVAVRQPPARRREREAMRARPYPDGG